MLGDSFIQRLQVQIDLAAKGNCVCAETRRRQDDVARKLGMTGAEIDAARNGRSFDIRLSRALFLAHALQSGDPARIARASILAAQSGFDREDLAVIERLAVGIQPIP
jgi:hypothetical protein